MLPDRVSNPGPLTYESGALPIALRGPANFAVLNCIALFVKKVYVTKNRNHTCYTYDSDDAKCPLSLVKACQFNLINRDQ